MEDLNKMGVITQEPVERRFQKGKIKKKIYGPRGQDDPRGEDRKKTKKTKKRKKDLTHEQEHDYLRLLGKTGMPTPWMKEMAPTDIKPTKKRGGGSVGRGMGIALKGGGAVTKG